MNSVIIPIFTKYTVRHVEHATETPLNKILDLSLLSGCVKVVF